MNEVKCIYCNSTRSKVLEVSDIIPDFMTNKKITRKNVCSKCNRDCSIFEATIASEFDYLLNHLEIKNKDKKIPRYKVEFKIDGTTFTRKITNKSDLFNGGVAVDKSKSPKYKFGSVENFRKWKNFSPEKLTTIENTTEIIRNIKLNTGVFSSSEILRTVAKIGYEWFCKENDINVYHIEFKPIVDFILLHKTDKPSYEGVAEVVVRKDMYTFVNYEQEFGGHAISTTYFEDGRAFVLFSFFGLVIYKIWIVNKALIYRTGMKMNDFYYIRPDGSTNVLQVYAGSQVEIKSKTPRKGVSEISDIVIQNFTRIFNMKYLSLKVVKRYMEMIKEIISQPIDEIQHDKLIGYKDERLLYCIVILKQLVLSKEKLNFNLDYNSNLKIVFDTEEIIRLNIDKKSESFTEEYFSGELNKTLNEGYELFMTFYNNEIS